MNPLRAALLASLPALLLAGAALAAEDEPAQADPALVQAWRKDLAAKADAARAAGSMTVVGADGWLFFAGELKHVAAAKFWGPDAPKVSQASDPANADPLPAIRDFHAALKALGVELLLVPIPPKAVIYPDKISSLVTVAPGSLPPRLDPDHQAFYDLLRQDGIRVLDLVPLLMRNRLNADGAMYCRQDTHYSGKAVVLVADAIRRAVADPDWLAAVPKKDYADQWQPSTISGDLWQGLKDESVPREELPLRFVGTRQGDALEPIEPDRTSPLILLGDSHTLVFSVGQDLHARGAGLPDQLALAFGFSPDVVGVRGSGATPARINLYRRSQSDPLYWDTKKLVVWCFTAREFTECGPSGWRILPVKK